jgi:membrane protease YdiL (CAAX protease family)
VANVTATAVVLTAARAAGVSWRELGLARDRLGAGARWGAACFVVIAAGYAVLLAAPATRPLLADERVAGLGAGELAYGAAVRIPLGTVLWEEVAFRGALLAALARTMPVRRAVGVSAAVFGLWHVRPTLSAVAVNDLTASAVQTGFVVLVACLAATAAGAVMAWLRLRSGSLLAPALLHLATNSLGMLAATVALPAS